MILSSRRHISESLYGVPHLSAGGSIRGLPEDELPMRLVAETMDFDSIACHCGERKETR